MLQKLLVLITVFHTYNCIEKSNGLYKEFDERSLVSNIKLFPYVAAVLRKSTYLSAGALIHNEWVLTSADALYLLREASRTLRVRLGSINYKKGGTVLPVKYVEIHPSFDDQSPIFDIALLRLPYPVRFLPSLKPVRLQRKLKSPDSTHFIITAWAVPITYSDDSEDSKSKEETKRPRILPVTHLPPKPMEVNQRHRILPGTHLPPKPMEVNQRHRILPGTHLPSKPMEVNQRHRILPGTLLPPKSMEEIKRQRILSVTQLHPSDHEDCVEELNMLNISDLQTIMCLDTGVMEDPCMRDVGAPVVINAVLWGIVSSWRPVVCENNLAGPSFVSLVSAPNISSWIYATVRGIKWKPV